MYPPRATYVIQLLLLSSACGETEITSFQPPSIAGCESVPTTPCDIQDEACVGRIQSLVYCLRGGDPIPLPQIDYLSPAEVEAEFTAQVPEPSPERRTYTDALVRLELLWDEDRSASSQAASNAGNVSGFYQAANDRLVVVLKDDVVDGADVASVLAHELVHHAQDQELDLETYMPGLLEHSDAHLGVLSSIEGEAELYQSMFLAALHGHDPHQIDYVARFDAWARRLEADLPGEASSPLLGPSLYFAYAHGARWIAQLHAEGGQAAVGMVFAAPPRSADLLGFGPLGGLPPPDELGDLEIIRTLSFGAWTSWVALSAMQVAEAEAAVRALEREQLFVVQSSTGSGFVWQLRFETEADAAMLVPLLDAPGRRRAVALQRDLFLYAADGFTAELRTAFGF